MRRLTGIVVTLFLLAAFAACDVRETIRPQTEHESGSETAATQRAPESATEVGTVGSESATAPEQLLSGWDFDDQTGTLYLYEQQYLKKTPFTGDPNRVKAVELGGSVTEMNSIGGDGLGIYTELKRIVLGDSVQFLNNDAFDGCFKTEQIVIGRGVRTIADAAFFGSDYTAGSIGCTGLKRIEVSKDNPNFTAEENVLYNKDRTELILYPMCREKTEYVMPDSVRKVRWFAFSGNQTIRKLTVGHGIMHFDFSLFNCNALRELTLPDTLQSIDDSTIKYCGLRSVTIPDSVTSLGIEAFSVCPNLTKIHIGKKAASTEDPVRFWFNCSALKDVSVDADNPNLCVVDGAMFSKDRQTLYVYPGGYTQAEYAVPDGTKEIAGFAFCESAHLKRIYIPASVTKIDVMNFCVYDGYEEDAQATYPFEIWYGGSRQQWDAATEGSGVLPELTVHYNAAGIG